MDSKVLYLILLTVSISAVASATFTYGHTDSVVDKAARTAWRDKGINGNGDYKLNTAYPTAYVVEEHRIGDGYPHGNYKDGGSTVNRYDKLGSKLNQGKSQSSHQIHGDDIGKNNRENGYHSVKDGAGKSDGYSNNYNHGYRHSHGYRSHHHRSNGKEKDGANDSHRGYSRVGFGHDHRGRNDDHGGCKYGGCCCDEFEFHYGDDGKEHNERNHSGDSGRRNDYGRNTEHSLDRSHNEGVDGHVPDYHYGYIESDGNYGKDHPSFASGYRYRGRAQDYDHGLIRYNHRKN